MSVQSVLNNYLPLEEAIVDDPLSALGFDLRYVLRHLHEFGRSIKINDQKINQFIDVLKKIHEIKNGSDCYGKRFLKEIENSPFRIPFILNDNGVCRVYKKWLRLHFDLNCNACIIIKIHGLHILEKFSLEISLIHEMIHLLHFIEGNISLKRISANNQVGFKSDLCIPATSKSFPNLEEEITILGTGGDQFSENSFRKILKSGYRMSHNGIVDSAKIVLSVLEAQKNKTKANKNNICITLDNLIFCSCDKELIELLSDTAFLQKNGFSLDEINAYKNQVRPEVGKVLDMAGDLLSREWTEWLLTAMREPNR